MIRYVIFITSLIFVACGDFSQFHVPEVSQDMAGDDVDSQDSSSQDVADTMPSLNPSDSKLPEGAPEDGVETPGIELASHLLINGSVHTGTDWGGQPTYGVWGADFDFKMDAYPVTWAIAVAHASLLLQSRGIPYNPNAVLSVAIKESSLKCLEAGFPNNDGCFQIEDTTAYNELIALFPDRFQASHADVINGAHFESSALSLVYYTLFSMGMFQLYHDDPYVFFANHSDPQAAQKVVSGAYNRGLWWEGLREVFSNCTHRDVTECFNENGRPHAIAVDHARSIADYTKALNQAPLFNPELSLQDLKDYWASIKNLYRDVDASTIEALLERDFKTRAGGSGKISFQEDLPTILNNLISALPKVSMHDRVTKAVCGRGYLWRSPPCP